jgi:hypothetical protein
VAQLEDMIQNLQQHITDLELPCCTRNSIGGKRPKGSNCHSTVGRLKSLALECKKLSNQSAQTYENLTENPELQALESQLQEAKKHADTLQATEGLVTSGKNEVVSRETHCPEIDPYDLE